MASDSGISDHTLRQAKIIIIDDEPEMAKILAGVLHGQGFTNTQSTTDPRTAIELCRASDPDLIILDLLMPYVSGMEVLTNVRAQLSADTYLPVLIMTGDPRNETKRKALASGATDFVTKPFDQTEIVLRTTNLLKLRMLHQGLTSQKRQLETAVRERTAELQAEVIERRRVEQSLREAEAKSRAIFENAVFGIFQVTPSGDILAVNSALAHLGGYESANELRASVTNVFAQLCASAEHTERFIRAMHEQGSVTGFEGPMYRKDGTVIWVSTTARTVRDSKGQVEYYEGTLTDISARRQAAAALASANEELEIRVQQRTAELTQINHELRASHQRLEAVLSATPVIIWTTDRDGVFTFAAGKVCNTIGQKPHQMVGKSVFELYRDFPQIAANHRRALRGESINTTVELNKLAFDARHVPLRNSSGEVEGMLGVAVDITERRHAEAALREQQEMFQTIFDHIPVMISLWDETGKFKLANREWERVIGWSKAEAQAEPNLLARCYPDAAEYERVLNLLRNPAGEWTDFRTQVCDGRVLDTSWTSVHLSAGTRIGLGMDITARKRADRELQIRLRQQAAVAALGQEALSGAELEELFNRAVVLVSETLGTQYSAVAEIVADRGDLVFRAGVGWKDELSGCATVPVENSTLAGYTLASREPVTVEDLRTETRFSGPQLLHEHGIISSMSVIVGSPEFPFGILCTHSSTLRQFTRDDVNFLQTVANVLASAIERREAERIVQSAKEEAERANRAKSEFLSRMSHELRTPLNAILGFAQLLELEEQFTGEIRDNVEQIIKGGRHLLALINEVLDISRIEAGKFSLSIEAVNAREAITESLSLVAPLAAKYSIHLDSASAQSSVYLFADRQRIRQVLLNLLSNAIKYNRDFGWVRVSCEYSHPEWVRIQVHDTGAGIAPEHISKLFVPFERLGIDQRDVEGAGIGLALSKRLVELMGGRIGVSSTLGDGSTFWIELPAAENPLHHTDVAEQETMPRAPDLHRHTVLHIEDNLSNLKLIERILLPRPDVRLIAAIQGELGIQLAREHQPDLILLDLHLPDMNGDEVLRRLRSDRATSGIPVIMLSADATAGQSQRLLAAGANEYLTKPLHVPKFQAVLNELFDKKQKEC